MALHLNKLNFKLISIDVFLFSVCLIKIQSLLFTSFFKYLRIFIDCVLRTKKNSILKLKIIYQITLSTKQKINIDNK